MFPCFPGELMSKPKRKKLGLDPDSEDSDSPDDDPSGGVPIIVDLAFASNVRFLDDHELHLDNVELYKTLPFAAGQALAR